MLYIDPYSFASQKIDVGEEEPRIVCSGLVAYMKPEEIQDQTIVVVVRICGLAVACLADFRIFSSATSSLSPCVVSSHSPCCSV